jgi:radical SAM superfamily enzyme YgiQ (UPF0313 family)
LKVLLIQTMWSQANHAYRKVGKRFAAYQPLSLLGLAAYAERAGHSADVLDLEVEDVDGYDGLVQKIRDSGAQLIGITITTPIYPLVVETARELRKRLDLPIVVGGAHVTALGLDAFDSQFDFAVANEGHETLVELMEALEGKRELSTVMGLMYRENGEARFNGKREFVKNLDDLPLPAWDKVDLQKYQFVVAGKGLIPVCTIELSRGCPYKCIFCSEPMNTGQKLRKRSPNNFVDQVEYAKKRFGITHFNIIDSVLTINRKLIEATCQELIDRKLDITFEGQTRADLVDEDLLRLMKRAGLRKICFGVESANKEVLRLMKKACDLDTVRKAFAWCEKLDIRNHVGLMMGSAGDTKKSIMETAWFARSLKQIRYAPMGIAVPYPGTALYEYARTGQHGLKLLTNDLANFSRWSGGVMEVDGMGPAELMKLQRRAMFVIHSRPTRIWYVLRHFGFGNAMPLMLKQVVDEVKSWFGLGSTGRELRPLYANNTTLKSIPPIAGDQSTAPVAQTAASRPLSSVAPDSGLGPLTSLRRRVSNPSPPDAPGG